MNDKKSLIEKKWKCKNKSYEWTFFGLIWFHEMLETQTQKVIFKLKSFNVLRRKKLTMKLKKSKSFCCQHYQHVIMENFVFGCILHTQSLLIPMRNDLSIFHNSNFNGNYITYEFISKFNFYNNEYEFYYFVINKETLAKQPKICI